MFNAKLLSILLVLAVVVISFSQSPRYEIMLNRPDITGLTGGGSTNLDGVTTTGLSIGTIVLVYDQSSGITRIYRLLSGTDAENSPLVIRPDDFNAVSNAKVWKLSLSSDADETGSSDTVSSGDNDLSDTIVVNGQMKVIGELIADSIQAVGNAIEIDDSFIVHGDLSVDGTIHGGQWSDSGTYVMVNGQKGVFGYENKGLGTDCSTHVNLGVACTTGSSKYCTVVGGKGNIATKDYSTIGGGYSNRVNAKYATIGGGDSNSIAGDKGTIAGGHNNSVWGISGTVGGGELNGAASNYSTVGGGYLNTASGLYSTVPGGREASAPGYGQYAYSSGKFASVGDAQYTLYVLRNSTSDTTTTKLYVDGSSLEMYVTVKGVWTFVIYVSAVQHNNVNWAGYKFEGVITRDISNNTTLAGLVKTVLHESNAAWDCNVSADDTHEILAITVKGASSANIRWVAVAHITEVRY